MLQMLSMPVCQPSQEPLMAHAPNLYERSEKEDMKKAIELLYDFRKSLGELHPNCITLIENMLQHRRY